MTDQDIYSRRSLLAATGASTATALAGCSRSLEDNSGEPSPDNRDDSSEVEYELDFSIDQRIDPTEEEYAELSYQLLENGSETSADGVKLILEGEEEEEVNEYGLEDSSQIPSDQLYLGNNTATLEAEIDGETYTAEQEVTKKPEGDMTFTVSFQEDSSPSTYDTVPNWKNYFWTKRREHHEHILKDAETDNIVQRTQEQNEIDFEPELTPAELNQRYSHGGETWNTEEFQSLDPETDRKEILNDGIVAWVQDYIDEGNPAPSTNAKEMSHIQAELMIQHHDLTLKDVMPFRVENVGHGTSNHYFPEDNTVLTSDVVGYVGNPGEQPDSRDEDRFATIPDYETGNVQNTSYERKKEEGRTAYRGPATIFEANHDVGNSLHVLDSTLKEGMDSMADGNFQQHFSHAQKLTAARLYFGKRLGDEFGVFSFKKNGREEIIISNSNTLEEKYRERIEEPEWNDIEQEIGS